MICDKGIEMKFVVLLLLGVFVWGDEGVRCIEREREAHVRFKNGLTDESGILSSWRGGECCNWYGVVCSNTTDGHVIHTSSSVLVILMAYWGVRLQYGPVFPQMDTKPEELSGELPNCFRKTTKLASLNLANNSFSGKMPHSLPDQLHTLSLSHNNLSGELPSNLRFCQELQLIDVGGNKLTGEIPSWIGAIHDMRFLNLRSNEFYGGVPPEMCNLTGIRVLDISRNNLSGRIPNCFNNLATLAEKDAAHAYYKYGYFVDHIYDPQLSNRKNIKFYDGYSSFQWKGQESEYRRNLVLLTLIDISSNRLSGNIPHSFSNLRGLLSFNLSRNSLTGNIIPNIGQMEMLECLDLSHNQLSGEIPTSLTQLHFLTVLDLSDNNLWGKIPSSTQLQSFNMSSYDGNNGLCGSPLALCPEDSPRPPTPTQGEEDDGLIWSLSFMQGLCISIGFGFIVGFWGAVGSLVLKKSWRYAYFNLLDDVGDWFYVRISILLSKWRQR